MNTHKNKFKKVIKYDRKYLGVTITAENYRDILTKEGRDGINFHTKHLRAYLKGKAFFTHGFNIDKDGNRTTPKVHRVRASLTKL